MSGIQRFFGYAVFRCRTMRRATRTPTSDAIKRSWLIRPPFYALFLYLESTGRSAAGTSRYKQDKGCEQAAAEYFGDMLQVDKQRGPGGGSPCKGRRSLLSGFTLNSSVHSTPLFSFSYANPVRMTLRGQIVLVL